MTESGITPTSLTTPIGQQTRSMLYSSIFSWLETHQKPNKLGIVDTTSNEFIQIWCIKGNAVSLHDMYYHAKYDITLRFADGQFTFEPTRIQLKINSKYDMGWKEVELSEPTSYFKKGKVIRKYKAYLEGMITPLNELHAGFVEYLVSQ